MFMAVRLMRLYTRGVYLRPGPRFAFVFCQFFSFGVYRLAFFFDSRIVLLLLYSFFLPYSYDGVISTPAQEEAVCSYYSTVS